MARRLKEPPQGARAAREQRSNGLSGFEAQIGIAFDAVQAQVFESETHRGILNCTRQWGKSTVAAAKAVHRAWTRTGSLTLVASPSGAAERGVCAKGVGVAAEAGNPAERRWG